MAKTVTAKVEGVLNEHPPRDSSIPVALASELKRLKDEASALRNASSDMSLGYMIGMFFRGGRLNAKERQSVLRQAEIQAEMARLRFARGISWAVVDVSWQQMRATAIARECVAEVALYEIEWAQAFKQPVVDDDAVTWATSTARQWMRQYLLPVLPVAVRQHICTTIVTSATYGAAVTTEDVIYLPAHGDLGKLKKGWGVLDGRTGDFWLRDVGRGVARNGRNALANNDTYNPPVYSFGLQPMITVDLSTFPTVVETISALA